MKNETIQVIIIDPFKKEVRKELIPKSQATNNESLDNYFSKLMSSGPFEVKCIESACLDTVVAKSHDAVIIDEEGLYHQMEKQKFFMVNGALPHPMAGIGIVAGVDENGKKTSASLSLEWIKEHVEFFNLNDLQHN